jgi:hypothetical protein
LCGDRREKDAERPCVHTPGQQIALDGDHRRGKRRRMQHLITTMGMGIVGLALLGGCALPQERAGGGDSAAESPGDWQFAFDEASAEVTARRGAEVMVYHLRQMGPDGEELLAGLRGHDGATWALPNVGREETSETVSQEQDPLVIVPYPPSFHTPSYTTPGYPAPQGGGAHHGAPPGWDSASWGRACRIAASMAGIAGCAMISAQCAVGTSITVGGLAIPCTLFIAFACTGVGWATSSYAEGCPK